MDRASWVPGSPKYNLKGEISDVKKKRMEPPKGQSFTRAPVKQLHKLYLGRTHDVKSIANSFKEPGPSRYFHGPYLEKLRHPGKHRKSVTILDKGKDIDWKDDTPAPIRYSPKSNSKLSSNSPRKKKIKKRKKSSGLD